MLERLANSVPSAPIPGLQTWGELLADLDGRLAHDRRIVTAARFDGVDQPSFCSSPILDGRSPLCGASKSKRPSPTSSWARPSNTSSRRR